MKRIINNQSGFSLMEVLIATAIMGAMAMGFVKLMENQTASLNYIDARNSEADLARQVQLIIADPAACMNSFGGLNAVTGDYSFTGADAIRDKNNNNFVAVGDRVGTSGTDVQITSITLVNVDVPLGAVVAPNTKSGTMNVVIETQRIKSNVAGGRDKRSQSLLSVTVDSANAVLDCSHTETSIDASEFCVNGFCRTTQDPADTRCNAGEVVLRINTGGGVECANITCPSGQALQGINTSTTPATPICFTP